MIFKVEQITLGFLVFKAPLKFEYFKSLKMDIENEYTSKGHDYGGQ